MFLRFLKLKMINYSIKVVEIIFKTMWLTQNLF
nr:MAG TPA: hypothetical protein [Caudoviricetes sp.]